MQELFAGCNEECDIHHSENHQKSGNDDNCDEQRLCDRFDELRGDVSWFCKKFDYRYENEDWGNSKDAVERAIKFLCGRD